VGAPATQAGVAVHCQAVRSCHGMYVSLFRVGGDTITYDLNAREAVMIGCEICLLQGAVL
jgi:hypothetical protein